jgi:hypothetical protein
LERIGVGFNPNLSGEEVADYARFAGLNGYDSFWLHENPLFKDAVSLLSKAIVATERMRLGSGRISFVSKSLIRPKFRNQAPHHHANRGRQSSDRDVPTGLSLDEKHLRFSKFAKTLLSIILASALWSIVFLAHQYDFWTLLSIATTLLLVISLCINGEKPKISRTNISARMIFYGLSSGLLLYALFYVGFLLTKSNAVLVQGVSGVYELRSNNSPLIIGLLLMFPISAGEETYWRGLVQRRFVERMGTMPGLLICASAYALVHLPTLNPILILTAFVGGIGWGLVYWRTKSLIPAIISHALWDMLIFVILPLA